MEMLKDSQRPCALLPFEVFRCHVMRRWGGAASPRRRVLNAGWCWQDDRGSVCHYATRRPLQLLLGMANFASFLPKTKPPILAISVGASSSRVTTTAHTSSEAQRMSTPATSGQRRAQKTICCIVFLADRAGMVPRLQNLQVHGGEYDQPRRGREGCSVPANQSECVQCRLEQLSHASIGCCTEVCRGRCIFEDCRCGRYGARRMRIGDTK